MPLKPAPLFDARCYAQSSKHLLHTNDPRGTYLGTVGAVRSPGLAGVWDNEAKEIVVADRAALRTCIPHHWRKAFDRAQIWWRTDTALGSTTLYSSRGRLLGTVYLYPRTVSA